MRKFKAAADPSQAANDGFSLMRRGEARTPRGSLARRAALCLEAARRPSGGEPEKQQSNRRAEKQNRNHKEIAGCFEPALKSLHDQINDPAHQPGGAKQEPDAKQSAPPIDRQYFFVLRAQ